MWSQIRYTQVSAQHSCAGRGPPVVRRIAPTPQLRPTTTRLSATGPQTNVASDAASLSQPSVPDASKPKGPTRPKVRGPTEGAVWALQPHSSELTGWLAVGAGLRRSFRQGDRGREEWADSGGAGQVPEQGRPGRLVRGDEG